MSGTYTPHEHYCEIELFHSKSKKLWRKECLNKNRPLNPAWHFYCDTCKHCILVTFEDAECIRANGIIRYDNGGVEVK